MDLLIIPITIATLIVTNKYMASTCPLPNSLIFDFVSCLYPDWEWHIMGAIEGGLFSCTYILANYLIFQTSLQYYWVALAAYIGAGYGKQLLNAMSRMK